MEDDLQVVIADLEYGAKKVLENLLKFYNYEQIDKLLEDHKKCDLPQNTPAPIYFSIRGLHLTRFILSYIDKLDNTVSFSEAIAIGMNFYNAGFAVGASIPSTGRDHFKKLYETEGIKAVSKKATDSRYAPGRDLYNEALKIAKDLWDEGSPLKHHQMKLHLIKEYQVRGRCPFAKFDPDCGYTEKGLLERLKGLAKEMNRPDLISGLSSVHKRA